MERKSSQLRREMPGTEESSRSWRAQRNRLAAVHDATVGKLAGKSRHCRPARWRGHLLFPIHHGAPAILDEEGGCLPSARRAEQFRRMTSASDGELIAPPERSRRPAEHLFNTGKSSKRRGDAALPRLRAVTVSRFSRTAQWKDLAAGGTYRCRRERGRRAAGQRLARRRRLAPEVGVTTMAAGDGLANSVGRARRALAGIRGNGDTSQGLGGDVMESRF